MFEKEAEEYAIENWEYYEEGQNDNKALKQAYLAGAEFGYNKVNEWHFVKDELPDEGTYLVIWQNDKGYKEIFIMHYEEDDEGELRWIDGDCEVQDEYIIAWKEITFPKEIKEND